MPSTHLILCHSLFFLPSIFTSIRVFSNELVVWLTHRLCGLNREISFSIILDATSPRSRCQQVGCVSFHGLSFWLGDVSPLLCVLAWFFLNMWASLMSLCVQIYSLVLFFFNFTLQYCYWFCHTLTWIHHRCTCVLKHEPSSHLPPHNISLGHHRAPAPSMLYPASDIDWQFDSYMIVYMFQCHSPKSSHPLPLPQSPKVRSTHLCLFCCLAYRVIIAIFLNSIYMC